MHQINSLNQVAEFHKTFGAPILPTPQIPDKNRCNLRVSLLAEELKELEEAIDNKDLIEIADALCDLQYVLSGAVLEFGLGDKFVDLFNEVQRSNMSKACNDEEEAISTIKFYHDKDGTIAHFVKDGNKYLVHRTADNKVLKSIKYSPADLGKIIHSD